MASRSAGWLRLNAFTGAVCCLLAGGAAASRLHSQAASTSVQQVPQQIDEEYTRLVRQSLQDPRITTELVDHLPASVTVPSPLKLLGRESLRPAS